MIKDIELQTFVYLKQWGNFNDFYENYKVSCKPQVDFCYDTLFKNFMDNALKYPRERILQWYKYFSKMVNEEGIIIVEGKIDLRNEMIKELKSYESIPGDISKMSDNDIKTRLLYVKNSNRKIISQDVCSVGTIYRHFKGHWYRVKSIGRETEKLTKVVIYEALYDCPEKDTSNGSIFVRPYTEFVSLTDKEKHPEAEQEYRFMNVSELIKQFGKDRTIEMLSKELIK